MKLLSHISPDGLGLPEPADARRLALGFEAWREALALSEGEPAFDLARSWSAADPGKRLLASIFGNSPFLSSVAVKEWAFLTRLLDEGADPLFSETAAGIEKPEDLGEDALVQALTLVGRRKRWAADGPGASARHRQPSPSVPSQLLCFYS